MRLKGRENHSITRLFWNLFQWIVVLMIFMSYVGKRVRSQIAPINDDTLVLFITIVDPAMRILVKTLVLGFVLSMLLFVFSADRSFKFFPPDPLDMSHWIPKLAVLVICSLAAEVLILILTFLIG